MTFASSSALFCTWVDVRGSHLYYNYNTCSDPKFQVLGCHIYTHSSSVSAAQCIWARSRSSPSTIPGFVGKSAEISVTRSLVQSSSPFLASFDIRLATIILLHAYHYTTRPELRKRGPDLTSPPDNTSCGAHCLVFDALAVDRAPEL